MQVSQKIILTSIIMAIFWTFSANCAPRKVYVKKAPPTVKVEVKPAAPYKNAVWISGHWAWRSNKHVWVAGHWVKPRNGHAWVPGHWVKKRRGWVWIGGHWKKL
jgi:hypothetical protein